MSLAGNSTSIKSLHPELQRGLQMLFRVAPQLGATVRVTSARRSRSQQVALYKNFLSGRSKYPVAVPGTSAHERGLAADLVVTPRSAQAALGAWWRSIGGTWSPKDDIHFELR